MTIGRQSVVLLCFVCGLAADRRLKSNRGISSIELVFSAVPILHRLACICRADKMSSKHLG